MFRKENITAYLTGMAVWFAISVASAMILIYLIKNITFWSVLIWVVITVMCSMGIMVGASVINLRKLVPGFERLAEGDADPEIPSVRCPVLTTATNAAIELASKRSNQQKSHYTV